MERADDIRKFLSEKVLLSESDLLSEDAENLLRKIRRERTDSPVIYISSVTSSIIAGSEKTHRAEAGAAESPNPRALSGCCNSNLYLVTHLYKFLVSYVSTCGKKKFLIS